MSDNPPTNSIAFEISGRYGLFTDPLSRTGGEKCSYAIPTFGALQGLMESVYWKPTLYWVIDAVRVLNPILTETKSMKLRNYGKDSNNRATYNLLRSPRYQILAHFEWNLRRTDLAQDRNTNKHREMAERSIERGGYRDTYLGARICQGDVIPCQFGESPGAFDLMDQMDFGLMFHSHRYPAQTGTNKLLSTFWRPSLKKGVIHFPRQDDPTLITKVVRSMELPPIAKEDT